MKLIDGKKTAQDIRAEIKAEVASRTAQGVRAPGLAVILVGEDPDLFQGRFGLLVFHDDLVVSHYHRYPPHIPSHP